MNESPAVFMELLREHYVGIHPNKIFDVQRTLAETEFVAVHSQIHMFTNDNGMAVIHLFRFQADEIVEM